MPSQPGGETGKIISALPSKQIFYTYINLYYTFVEYYQAIEVPLFDPDMPQKAPKRAPRSIQKELKKLLKSRASPPRCPPGPTWIKTSIFNHFWGPCGEPPGTFFRRVCSKKAFQKPSKKEIRKMSCTRTLQKVKIDDSYTL